MKNCKGIFQAYGMTETSLTATKDIDDDKIARKPGSAGYPLNGVKAKVSPIQTFSHMLCHTNIRTEFVFCRRSKYKENEWR